MRYSLILLLAAPLILSGCIHHHPTPKANVRVKPQADVVIVHTRPAVKGRCVRYRYHWRCYR